METHEQRDHVMPVLIKDHFSGGPDPQQSIPYGKATLVFEPQTGESAFLMEIIDGADKKADMMNVLVMGRMDFLA
jgi:hypothetical protein